MTYSETGKNYDDCIRKIQARNPGKHFQILEQRQIEDGGFLGLFTRPAIEIRYFFPGEAGNLFAKPRYPSASLSLKGDALEEQKRQLITAAGKDPKDMTMMQVLSEVRDIKTRLKDTIAPQAEHPSIIKINQILKDNDFSESYIRMMNDRIRRELPLETLDDYQETQDNVLEWIGESVSIYQESSFQWRPRIMILVGPTGAGKTSTLAKLATLYGTPRAGRMPLRMRIITIDVFKIGAREQVEKFANIMEIPLEMVSTHDELRKSIGLCHDDTDMILVDTIGSSPRDAPKLGEMQAILSACGDRAEVHLVVDAKTKSSDIETIMRQFEPFGYQAVIVTKTDETGRLGNVISALAAKRKSVSFITNGQNVPRDIQLAQVMTFLNGLEDFTFNRSRLDKKFPWDESKVIRWR